MAKVTPFIRVSADKKKSDKEVNIRFRVAEGRDLKLFYKSDLKIKPDLWSEKNEGIKDRISVFTMKEADKKNFNQSVADRKKIVSDAFDSLTERTSEALNVAIDKILHPERYIITEAKKTFFLLFAEFLTKHKLSDVRIKNFRVLGRTLQRYEIYTTIKTKKPFTLDIDSLSKDDLHLIDDYFKNEAEYLAMYPDIYKQVSESRQPQQRGQNTISGLLAKFRTFVLWCNKEGHTSNNPFAGYTIPAEVYGTPYYLTIEERNSLFNTDISHRPQLAIQRDIFVFQCVIGCRVGDLLKMTKANIIDGAIEYIPRKTKEGHPVTVQVPLNKIAIEILSRYPDGAKLLPFISEQKYNDAIKEAFLLAGLTRMVTVINPTTGEQEQRPLNEIASSHLARRTLIGNLYKKVQDPNLVSSLSGHKEGSKAFARYREIDREMRNDLVKLIE